MKLFTLLWLIMATRFVGAVLGGRECMRIRHRTRNRMTYEWFTALGVGMTLWGVADLGLIWNSVVNGPSDRTAYPPKLLFYSIMLNLLETFAVWVVTLVLLNGGTPGWIRKGLFWGLVRLRIMDKTTEEDNTRKSGHP